MKKPLVLYVRRNPGEEIFTKISGKSTRGEQVRGSISQQESQSAVRAVLNVDGILFESEFQTYTDAEEWVTSFLAEMLDSFVVIHVETY